MASEEYKEAMRKHKIRMQEEKAAKKAEEKAKKESYKGMGFFKGTIAKLTDKEKEYNKQQSKITKEDSNDNPIKCPKCGSTQLTAGNKGFSTGKAIAGDIIAGPVGLVAGAIGSKKIIITCLNCGHKWEAGKK